jgi:hypothetical protein
MFYGALKSLQKSGTRVNDEDPAFDNRSLLDATRFLIKEKLRKLKKFNSTHSGLIVLDSVISIG